jgi:hypothetical protein
MSGDHYVTVRDRTGKSWGIFHFYFGMKNQRQKKAEFFTPVFDIGPTVLIAALDMDDNQV